MSRSLHPNSPAVSSETFDTEVVIVNFDTGTYHSVQGTGVEVWRRIEQGATAEELEAALAARYEGGREAISAAVAEFTGQLLALGLVVGDGDGGAPAARDDVTAAAEKLPFVAPTLNTFTDMQELLWLDPIHEVDEAGWPVPARDAKD